MKNYIFFILFVLLINIISKDTNDLLVFKFKTYYPETGNNNSEYTSLDFINSFILSKIYLELESGNEEEFKKGTNQILRTFIGSKANIFVFREFNKYNKLLCNFNTTSSHSYYNKMLSSQYCESEQVFKINTDFELKEYLFNKFYIENYFCLNDSLCADIGIDIQTFQISGRQDFLTQLHKILNSSEQNFCFNYLNPIKEEGVFTFGIMPHNYSKKYDEKNIITFYTQPDSFSILFDTITINGKEYFKQGEKNNYYTQLDISLEKEGIEFDQYHFDILKEIYFNYYIEKGICKNEESGINTKIIFCYGNQFNIKDIKKFPKINFVKYNINFNITFEGEELFYYKNNKYFCKIYCKYSNYRKFDIGRILLKKYLIAFNADKKQIYFYKNSLEKNEEVKEKSSIIEKYEVVIIISFVALIVIIYVLGFLTGKYIYQGRKKKANELEDNYDYKIDKNNRQESLYNEREEEE